jgi:hypothetical protein
MDDETLKRLMIDDALGALSPDVSSLLSAYSETVPAGKSERSAWRSLAMDARRALSQQTVEDLPPFPATQRISLPWRFARIGISAAAMLAIGVGIGLRMPRAVPPRPEVAVAVQPAATELAGSNDMGGFWSSQRLLAYAEQQKRPKSSSLRWTSPVKMPEIGELK